MEKQDADCNTDGALDFWRKDESIAISLQQGFMSEILQSHKVRCHNASPQFSEVNVAASTAKAVRSKA